MHAAALAGRLCSYILVPQLQHSAPLLSTTRRECLHAAAFTAKCHSVLLRIDLPFLSKISRSPDEEGRAVQSASIGRTTSHLRRHAAKQGHRRRTAQHHGEDFRFVSAALGTPIVVHASVLLARITICIPQLRYTNKLINKKAISAHCPSRYPERRPLATTCEDPKGQK